MTYSTSNPPKLLVPCLAATGSSIWTYSSTDAATSVDASGYITNAKDLGMKVNDLVFAVKTDDTPPSFTSHSVVAINTNGSADLANGVAIAGSSNSD